MATCRTCNNFYMGSECPFCRIERMKVDPDLLKHEEELKKEREYIETHYNELSNAFLMTTGNDFVGYEIKEYLGVLSDGVVQGTGWLSELSADFNDFFGTESNTFAEKMRMCRETALEKLKRSAIQRKANALVSIDFETTTFRNNMIGIMVTGTAVRIEKTKFDSSSVPENDNAVPSSVRNRRAARSVLDYDL